jgi:hypothetical protein
MVKIVAAFLFKELSFEDDLRKEKSSCAGESNRHSEYSVTKTVTILCSTQVMENVSNAMCCVSSFMPRGTKFTALLCLYFYTPTVEALRAYGSCKRKTAE